MIALHISSNQEAYYVSTLQDNDLSKGFITYSKLVWDLGIIHVFSLVQLIDCRIVMALLENKQYLEREECNLAIFGFPCSIMDMTFGVCISLIRGDYLII